MKTLRKICLGAVFGAVLSLGSAVALANGSNSPPTIVGTWQFEMTVRVDAPDCPNSPQIPFGPNPFPALISYHEGGTLNEYGSRSPPSVRSTGFGAWKKTGSKKYKAVDTFMEFDSNGLLWRTMVIKSELRLNNKGNKYSGINRLELTDVSGNVLKFCATVEAVRFAP
jgi:hypothetical protein